jgi:hypothetical protein
MKKFKVIIIDKKNGNLIESLNEFSLNKEILKRKYEYKYKFIYPNNKIIIKKYIDNTIIQLDLLNFNKEMEVTNV